MRSRVVLPVPLRPESVSRSRRSSLNETPRKSGSPAMSFPRSDAMATAMHPMVGAGRRLTPRPRTHAAAESAVELVLLGRGLRRELVRHAAPARDHRRVGRGLALPRHARAAGGAEDRDAGHREARVDARPITPLAPDIPPHGPEGSAQVRT